MLQKFSSYSVEPPSLGQLVAVATASGLPFVGFGFTDNAIMVGGVDWDGWGLVWGMVWEL